MKTKLENISLSFQDGGERRTIINNLSYEIDEGQFLMIIGPSGCGKSSLLNVTGGLLKPEKGRVLFDNTDYYQLSEKKKDAFRRDNIGYVFQEFFLIDDLSPVDNLMIMMPSSVSFADKKKRAVELIERFGLGKKLESSLSTFSGGEKQRLAIARALSQDSTLILCDEPTGNLDEENAELVVRLLRTLANEGRTVVMVTHNRAFCAQADTVLDLGALNSSNKAGDEVK